MQCTTVMLLYAPVKYCEVNAVCRCPLCSTCRVDVVCNAHKGHERKDNSFYSMYGDNDDFPPLIEDTPKSLAIGVMKTVSATSKAADWRQVKLGKQWGYEVGKISGEM